MRATSRRRRDCGGIVLVRLFDIPPARLESLLAAYYCHDWEADPCSLGAYSYAPAGALDASGRIAEPVENTLFFAGEHPDVGGHWGTVHGALASGDSAARRLLAAGRGAAADVDPG